MKKKLTKSMMLMAVYIAVAAICFLSLAPREAMAAQGSASIHVLPFNYSDAILVESDGHFGMVDSGEDSSYPDGSDPRYPLRDGITKGDGHENEVAEYLESAGVTSENFDFYIGTHPHSDHIGSASQIIRRFKPKRIYTPSYDDSYITDPARLWDNRYVYDRLIEAANEAAAEYGAELIQSFGGDGTGFYLGSAYIQLYNTDTSYQAEGVFDANCFSLGVKVTAGGYTAFLAGDINNFTGSEDRIAPELGHIDFLKMGHHGNPGSNTESYLMMLCPELVMQTGDFSVLPAETIDALCSLQTNYICSNDVVAAGERASIITLSPEGLSSNVDVASGRLYYSNSVGSYLYYENGVQASRAGWVRVAGGWTWLDGTPSVHTQRWVWDRGEWYWIKSNGLMATGWWNIGGVWYFFEPSGMMATGWKIVDGSWSYFDESGAMRTGWVKAGTSWYLLDSSGCMQVGWQFVNGAWYYLDGSGSMHTGWLNVGSSWYYLSSSGAMQTGWQNVGNLWYYLDSSGDMRTGWRLVGGNWYYMNGSGAMAHDCWVGNYYLRSDGAMAVNSRIGTYWVGDSGEWIPGA